MAPAYAFNRNPFTFCGSISPASVPSVNVPFSAATIQYGPVYQNRSFSGILPMHDWNTNMALPSLKSSSLRPQCLSTNAFRRCWFNSNVAKLLTRASPRARSCWRRTCFEPPSSMRSLTCMRKLDIWNSIGITASKPYAKQNGVACMLVLKLVLYAHSVL